MYPPACEHFLTTSAKPLLGRHCSPSERRDNPNSNNHCCQGWPSLATVGYVRGLFGRAPPYGSCALCPAIGGCVRNRVLAPWVTLGATRQEAPSRPAPQWSFRKPGALPMSIIWLEITSARRSAGAMLFTTCTPASPAASFRWRRTESPSQDDSISRPEIPASRR
jgi:hypothetical protein